MVVFIRQSKRLRRFRPHGHSDGVSGVPSSGSVFGDMEVTPRRREGGLMTLELRLWFTTKSDENLECIVRMST